MAKYVCIKRYFGSSTLGQGGFVAANTEVDVPAGVKLPKSHFILKSKLEEIEDEADEGEEELTPQQKAAKTKAEKKAAAEAAKTQE